MFNRIIVGFDGSEGSRSAMERAASLVKLDPSASLLVAYVNEDGLTGDMASPGEPLAGTPLMPDASLMPPDPNSPRQLARDYAIQMTEAIRSDLNRHQIQGEILAIDGHPSHALSELAEKEKADALIVGNSGKSGFQKFFVGSVSEKLVKEAPCTVIVVK